MAYNRHDGERWSREDTAKLRTLYRQQTPPLVIARLLGRSLRALEARRAKVVRRRTNYRQGKDGDVAVIPRNGWYKLACCDCGLVHLFHFATVNAHGKVRGQVAFIARRDNRATAALRRHHRYPYREIPVDPRRAGGK